MSFSRAVPEGTGWEKTERETKTQKDRIHSSGGGEEKIETSVRRRGVEELVTSKKITQERPTNTRQRKFLKEKTKKEVETACD